MTQRDRTILMVLAIVLAVGGFWFAALKPKRDEVATLNSKITAAQQRLDSAVASARDARKAKEQYATDYATVAKLGKAVPVDDDTPSLVYQLENAADRAGVDFRSIQLSGGGSSSSQSATTNSTPAGQVAATGAAEKEGSSGTTSTPATPTPAAPATQTAAATLPPGAVVGDAGFPTMPFDFAFRGRFFRLESFLDQLDKFTRTTKDGRIVVRGRLLTVDGIAVSSTDQSFPKMTAQIHATAYLLPADQGLTAGATPAGPATAPGSTATDTTASTGTPVATAGVTR